jgi:hypothetical protein
MNIGDTYIIQRTILDVDAVKIELTRDGGISWEIIEPFIPIGHRKIGDTEEYDDLIYYWVVTGPVSELCAIKVSGVTEIISNISSTFSISLPTTTAAPTTTALPTTTMEEHVTTTVVPQEEVYIVKLEGTMIRKRMGV